MLVGTKLDLVEKAIQKREVSYQEAVAFAQKYSLAGVIETSAKSDVGAEAETQLNLQDSGDIKSDRGSSDPESNEKGFRSIDDCFFVCTCKCVDQARIELMELENIKHMRQNKNNLMSFLNGLKSSDESMMSAMQMISPIESVPEYSSMEQDKELQF